MQDRYITGSDLALRVVFGVASESNVLESANSRFRLVQATSEFTQGVLWVVGFGLLFKIWPGKAKADKIAYSYCTTASTPSEIHKGLLK